MNARYFNTQNVKGTTGNGKSTMKGGGALIILLMYSLGYECSSRNK